MVWAADEGGAVSGGGLDGGIGSSEMMWRRVSAATMPPMLWPTRMVRTLGSTVGEGVPAETSRSMMTFCSLHQTVKRHPRSVN